MRFRDEAVTNNLKYKHFKLDLCFQIGIFNFVDLNDSKIVIFRFSQNTYGLERLTPKYLEDFLFYHKCVLFKYLQLQWDA